jgi:hypothetical protein
MVAAPALKWSLAHVPLFRKLTNIEQRRRNLREHGGLLVAPVRYLTVTESLALLLAGDGDYDRSSGRNPAARNSTASLPAMPEAPDAFTHLAGTYRI